MKFRNLYFFFSLLLLLTNCQENTLVKYDADLIIRANTVLTETILEDGFTPPVASRIYAYSNIAAYETLVYLNGNKKSFAPILKGLEIAEYPSSTDKIIPELASLKAFVEMAKDMVYRDKILDQYLDHELDSLFSSVSNASKNESLLFGIQIAEQIKAWAKEDGYLATRKMPIYIPLGRVDTWEPTAPAYGEAVEPHWYKIRPFLIDSSAQFTAKYPIEFSTKENSDFYKAVIEVYETVNQVDSNSIETAKFWDCNPQMSQTKGHVMYKVRQITPGGHWIGITSIATKMEGLSVTEASYIHTLVSMALADGFYSAWHAKYYNNLIRPETYINRYIDKLWTPILETPPFPEYPSAHSVVSGSVSTILENYFGENFKYIDNVEDPYGLPARTFNSFYEAAEQASISRVFGGIHYRMAVDDGLVQGRKIGNYINSKL